MQMVAYQFLQDPGAGQLAFAHAYLHLCYCLLTCSEQAVQSLPALNTILSVVRVCIFLTVLRKLFCIHRHLHRHDTLCLLQHHRQ